MNWFNKVNLARPQDQREEERRKDQRRKGDRRSQQQRRDGRSSCEALTCELGEVVGLSTTGMRVRHKGACRLKPGDLVTLTLPNGEGKICLQGRIKFIKKVAFRCREIGLEFADLSPQAQATVKEIARDALETMDRRQGKRRKGDRRMRRRR